VNGHCRNCRKSLARRGTNRADRSFCDAVCTAAYARESGRFTDKHIHAEKGLSLTGFCVVCGGIFFYNTYADRSGQRKPLYDSAACRQKAYRLRQKLKLENIGE